LYSVCIRIRQRAAQLEAMARLSRLSLVLTCKIIVLVVLFVVFAFFVGGATGGGGTVSACVSTCGGWVPTWFGGADLCM